MITEERVLAIDYGKKRVGLAITDPLGIFAIALKTLDNDRKFWVNLKSIILEKNVAKIVLGYPLKENGEKSDSTLLIEKFHTELKRKTKLEIELIDERYTSSIAKERILLSVKSKKKRQNKKLVDKEAAAIILEDYLNSLN